MLVEAGLPSLEQRIHFVTSLLIQKIALSEGCLVEVDAKQCTSRKKAPKTPSALYNAIQIAKQLDIPILNRSMPTPDKPPWFLNPRCINTQLTALRKTTTTKEEYQQKFLELMNTENRSGFNFVFTDGSKNAIGTAFAVTTQDGLVLLKGLLRSPASIFSAEALAVLKAIETSSFNKTVVCTDSLSTLEAVKNIANKCLYPTLIRNKLLCNPNKLILMWIPGHVGIQGNETADLTAKSATSEPLNTFYIPSRKDTRKEINLYWRAKQLDDWSLYQHHYTVINPYADRIIYPTKSFCKQLRIYIRLRLGHTMATHGHIIRKADAPICHLCNENKTQSIKHLVYDCAKVKNVTNKLFSNTTLANLIATPSEVNINKTFLIICKLNLEKDI